MDKVSLQKALEVMIENTYPEAGAKYPEVLFYKPDGDNQYSVESPELYDFLFDYEEKRNQGN